MARVADLGCIVCRKLGHHDTPAMLHHPRSGTGWGRASHMDVLPLCYFHHQGAEGIHTLGSKAWARKYWTEAELLEDVRTLLCL